MARVVVHVGKSLETDPQDSRHLFWEEMKRIFYAMRELRLEDLDKESMDGFMAAMEEVSNALHRISKRSRSRKARTERLRV